MKQTNIFHESGRQVSKPNDLDSSGQTQKPPLFKRWTQWYVLVIAFLIFLIIIFYFFTKAFA